jgi:methionine-rich copper-binding protein CopC
VTATAGRRGELALVSRALASLALAFAALGFVALLAPAVASAHAIRIATDPPENAALATGPKQVSATFNEHLQTTFAAMNVVGPDGNLWSTGEPRVVGAVISVDVMPLGPVGTYTVNYRVTSADGHVVSGGWPFWLTSPGNGKPGPPVAGSAGGGGIGIWPFFIAAAVLVAGSGWWALRRRRA